jgi:hypothetical protein
MPTDLPTDTIARMLDVLKQIVVIHPEPGPGGIYNAARSVIAQAEGTRGPSTLSRLQGHSMDIALSYTLHWESIDGPGIIDCIGLTRVLRAPCAPCVGDKLEIHGGENYDPYVFTVEERLFDYDLAGNCTRVLARGSDEELASPVSPDELACWLEDGWACEYVECYDKDRTRALEEVAGLPLTEKEDTNA